MPCVPVAYLRRNPHSCVEQTGDVIRDGERRGQSRRLDAEEIDEAGDAVVARPGDGEILRGLAGPGGLRPDAGIAGLQGAVPESRVIAADGRVEGRFAARVEAVFHAVDPGEVRPELDPPA